MTQRNARFRETSTTTSDPKLGTPESIGVANLKCDDGSKREPACAHVPSACLRGAFPSLTLTPLLRVAKLDLGYIKVSLAN